MIRYNGLPRATGFLILALDHMCRDGGCDHYITLRCHLLAQLHARTADLHGGSFLAESPYTFATFDRIPRGDRDGLRAALYEISAGAQS